jgi:predicted DNA-binding transcriptional regulator YafY
LRCATYQ